MVVSKHKRYFRTATLPHTSCGPRALGASPLKVTVDHEALSGTQPSRHRVTALRCRATGVSESTRESLYSPLARGLSLQVQLSGGAARRDTECHPPPSPSAAAGAADAVLSLARAGAARLAASNGVHHCEMERRGDGKDLEQGDRRLGGRRDVWRGEVREDHPRRVLQHVDAADR